MKMKIDLFGMFNNIINEYTKAKDKKLVNAILIDQLYNDLSIMLDCKTAKDCQDFVKEMIDFYNIKKR